MTKQSKWDDHVTKQWDKNASYWVESSELRWKTGSRKDIIPFFKKYVPQGSKLLDIGCGPGVSTDLFAQEGYEASGADVSSEMIEAAKDLYPDLSFQVANVAKMEQFKNNQYDSAVAINVLEWTEQPVEAIQALRRVIKHEGFICVAILGPTAGPRTMSYNRLYGKQVIQNTMMPWEFTRLAQENQLEVVDSLYVYRKGVQNDQVNGLKEELKQALTFMTVFMLRNRKEDHQ
ncbi:MAG TPA: class I SAM-dependent methyltransferase [Pseudogracilibacillus sp.]|nr:class I SAM-dependent methyltransferase [Pseudogracilibacillus sp.]